MPGPVFAEGDPVTLRPIEEEDLDFLRRWRNHPEVRVPLTDTEPVNAEQMRERFEEESSDGGGMRFLVCARDAEPTREVPEDAEVTPVGEIGVPWVREPHGTAMMMYWIAPPHQGEGYVTEATELLLDHAFGERRLAKVWATVLESNEASRRVLEKVGFAEEGRQRKETLLAGERVDSFRYSILAEEWLDGA